MRESVFAIYGWLAELLMRQTRNSPPHFSRPNDFITHGVPPSTAQQRSPKSCPARSFTPCSGSGTANNLRITLCNSGPRLKEWSVRSAHDQFPLPKPIHSRADRDSKNTVDRPDPRVEEGRTRTGARVDKGEVSRVGNQLRRLPPLPPFSRSLELNKCTQCCTPRSRVKRR